MSVLPIYNCFHPVLKQKTKAIENIDDNINQLVRDMFDTMRNTERGVGLAANQVGKDNSIIIIDVSDVDELDKIPPLVLINPIITAYSDETGVYQEGCLSVPVLYEDVVRPDSISITYYDLNEKEIKMDATGFLARVMQHEVDHLNGILFFERLSSFRKTLAKNKLKKLQKGEYDVDYPMIDVDGKAHTN